MNRTALFLICFYVATCIGIYMKAHNLPGYAVHGVWIAIFPFLYVYAFFVLLIDGTINPFRLIRLFCSRIAVYLLLRSIKDTEIELKSKVVRQEAISIQIIKRHSTRQTPTHISIVSETNQNIRKTFSYA